MRKRMTAALAASVLVLAGCGSSSGGAGPEATGPIVEPEKTTIKVALSAPNMDSQAPVQIALDKGFYEEEGLTVEVIDAQSIREGLVGGSLDIGVDNTVDLIDAADAGTGLKIVAGYRNREPYYIAASGSVRTPQDLAGKQVILGDAPGTPIIDVRLNLLKEAGFDLEGVDYKAVFPPGFSNAWVEQFAHDQVALTPLFPRHVPKVEAAGGHLVLREWKEWPNDSIAASEEWIEQNPNTLARFLRATIKGTGVYLDPANQEYVTTMMAEKGFTVSDAERDPKIFAEGPRLYDRDHGLNRKGIEEAVEALRGEVPDFDSYTDLTQLRRAQTALDLAPRP